MPARLGPRQIQLLGGLGRAGTALVCDDRLATSLIDRGLLAAARIDPDGERSCIHITPDGLRALAECAERGLIELAPQLRA